MPLLHLLPLLLALLEDAGDAAMSHGLRCRHTKVGTQRRSHCPLSRLPSRCRFLCRCRCRCRFLFRFRFSFHF